MTVFVRFKPGAVSESRRESHVAHVPHSGGAPRMWQTHCGLDIAADLAEESDQPMGMPCLRCLGNSSSFTSAAVEPGPS